IYRVSIGAAITHLKWSEFAPSILLAVIGSLLAGFFAAKIWLRLTERVDEAPSAIILPFTGTFVVWIVAAHLGPSGTLTRVAYALPIARTAPARTPARLRVPAYAVWDTAVFVLNVLAFILIGLQLRPIWTRFGSELRLEYCTVAASILVAVILTRVLW